MGAIFFHFTTLRITRTRLRKYLTTNITALNTPFIIPYATSIIISFIISITPFTIAEFVITVAVIIISVITVAFTTIITTFTTITTFTAITSFIITVAFTTIITTFTTITTFTAITSFIITVTFTTIIMGAPSSVLPFVPSLGALGALRRSDGYVCSLAPAFTLAVAGPRSGLARPVGVHLSQSRSPPRLYARIRHLPSLIAGTSDIPVFRPTLQSYRRKPQATVHNANTPKGPPLRAGHSPPQRGPHS